MYNSKYDCQEPPCTWEDVINFPDVPDGDHDCWGYSS